MNDKTIVVTVKFFKGELNPFDAAALEYALQTGAKVTVLSMSPPSAYNALQSLTRLGVRAVLLSDNAYAGSDTLATGKTLAKALRMLNPDYVFCGRQSVDGDTAQVPPILSEILGFDFVQRVVAFAGAQLTLRNGKILSLQERTVFTFERCCTLRFPSIFSKIKEVEVWDNKKLNIPIFECGQKGSPTRVIKSYESTVSRRNCKFVSLEEFETIIQSSLEEEKAFTQENQGEKLGEVYYVGDIEKIAKTVGKTAIPLKIEKKSPLRIARELQEKKIKTVLWEDSDAFKNLAPRVSYYANAALCADCIAFRVENEKWIMTRPALGGNITADIVCDSEIAMATVRTVKKEGTDVIFSVGKGAVHRLNEIRELAKKFNAEICCSRSVVDSGVLPYTSQVGLTGKIVCPKVYVAFGISGAVQHTCAIESAQTVIAVNVDKNARIFDYADYGIIAEV